MRKHYKTGTEVKKLYQSPKNGTVAIKLDRCLSLKEGEESYILVGINLKIPFGRDKKTSIISDIGDMWKVACGIKIDGSRLWRSISNMVKSIDITEKVYPFMELKKFSGFSILPEQKQIGYTTLEYAHIYVNPHGWSECSD